MPVSSLWSRVAPELMLLGLVAAGSLLLAMVGWSPVALRTLDDGSDWERLGAIAQAYGAVSAVLSVAATVGVAASLLMQAREIKINRIPAQRALHIEMLKMAMAEPSLVACWGEIGLAPLGNANQLIYLNVIFTHWEMMFKLGDMTLDSLREECRTIFSGEPARRYWARAGDRWRGAYASRVTRRFVAVVDEEYTKARPDPLTANAGGDPAVTE